MNKEKKLKVATVVGTRPEIIRLSRVLSRMDHYFDHVLIHTGQNSDYELNEIFFKELELRKPDHFLDAVGATAAQTIGNIISKVDQVLESIRPEALLVLGDTNSCLSVIPAKRRKIPVFHMEAGNRCFDERVPEEINRRIVDHTADINMPYSTIARSYLISEGIPPDRVIKTGSPMYEVLNYFLPKIQDSDVLRRLSLQERSYFVVSAHREENVDSTVNLRGLKESLDLICEEFNQPIVFSTHPRTRIRIEKSGMSFHPLVQFHKPLGLFDYVKLQMNSSVTLSDSGTINEESSILNFPAVNIREAHERPEGMEEAVVPMTGLLPERVLQGVRMVLEQKRSLERSFRLVEDYSAPNVSEKVCRIILSYVGYVNRRVWQRFDQNRLSE